MEYTYVTVGQYMVTFFFIHQWKAVGNSVTTTTNNTGEPV